MYVEVLTLVFQQKSVELVQVRSIMPALLVFSALINYTICIGQCQLWDKVEHISVHQDECMV